MVKPKRPYIRQFWEDEMQCFRVLTVGDLEEWVALMDKLMQDGNIAFLQEYTARKKNKYRRLHSHWNNFWIGY